MIKEQFTSHRKVIRSQIVIVYQHNNPAMHNGIRGIKH